ncbi:MAG TPA: TylF/MycF/NovP-related O-methyltransferase [Pyrinomonadaceae bacterium]|nr:TylF/MycF/NovP-related O-methyltransferase [Pyrinomonadaceae bacterium]
MPLTAVSYSEDGLITQHNADFMNEERFARAYRIGESTNSWNGWQTHWRSHVACWAADRAKYLEGDFVECGVNKGAISLMVMEYIDFAAMPDRKFYLLDTYEGLVEKYISDEEKSYGRKAGGYEKTYEIVRQTFSSFKNAVIIKGVIPESLPQADPEKVCYLSLDMNCVEPEIAAAEYFWDRMVSGATIILDDYGWKGHIVQKRAFDEFASKRNVPLLCLPTGQGVIIKP